MPSVLYHTKTHNQKIKDLLNNPLYGKELIRKLTSNEIDVRTVLKDTGEKIKTYFITLGEGDNKIEVKVKELVYTNK